MSLLGRASKRFNLGLMAFCLMSNHFHLFLRTPSANLSEAMHWLNGTYTGYFNWRHQRCGHLLQGRFKSVLVLDESHYLHLSMYMHLNPVRAGMVEDPADYSWSSFRDYARAKSRYAWLANREILSHYGASESSRRREYRRDCLALMGQTPAFVEQLKTSSIIGPKEAVAKIVKQFRPSGRTEEVPGYSRAASAGVDFGRELDRLAKIFGVKPEEIKSRNYNFKPRQAAYYHLVENCGARPSVVAKELGVSPAAVTMGVKLFKPQLGKNPRLRKILSQLI